MGFLDDAVPGGNIAKPLLVALGVLLAGKMFAGRNQADNDDAEPARDTRNDPSTIPDRRSPQADTPMQRDAGPSAPRQGDGGILDGLGDLLDKISNNGQKDAADSWVKPGAENKPIQPRDLGKAIGQKTLSEIARQSGMSEEELLDRLSKVLPGVVDKLTPEGRVPSNQEVARQFPNSPW
ncbi:MAG: YidB family protein [Rhizobiaceae bacterium]